MTMANQAPPAGGDFLRILGIIYLVKRIRQRRQERRDRNDDGRGRRPGA
jgi:hypothetical protein